MTRNLITAKRQGVSRISKNCRSMMEALYNIDELLFQEKSGYKIELKEIRAIENLAETLLSAIQARLR
ncbi:hypothetical protein KKG41_01595 [Patescibacteria group bacterium]|nr:hypothetical protein [Patescibacteria group bacterium]